MFERLCSNELTYMDLTTRRGEVAVCCLTIRLTRSIVLLWLSNVKLTQNRMHFILCYSNAKIYAIRPGSKIVKNRKFRKNR